MGIIFAIIKKELKELFREKRLIIFSFQFPLIQVLAIAGVLLYVLYKVPSGVSLADEEVPSYALAVMAGRNITDSLEFVLTYIIKIILAPLFWMHAVIITPLICSDSIVGEKERGTIEPLLATPITDLQLLMGKVVSCAVIPFVALSTSWLLFTIGMNSYLSVRVGYAFLDIEWVVSFLAVVPLLILMSVIIAVFISSKATSVKAATQLNSLLGIPLVIYYIFQLFIKKLHLHNSILYIVLFLLIVISILLFISAKFFNRERLIVNR